MPALVSVRYDLERAQLVDAPERFQEGRAPTITIHRIRDLSRHHKVGERAGDWVVTVAMGGNQSTSLVSVKTDKQKRIYSLDPKGVQEVSDWMARVQAFWNPRLDALEAALKKDSK